MPVALIIGLARGVNHVLTEGMISDTMLNAASNLVAGMSGPLFVVCLLLIFFVLGFVVPSSSGLAVLAMPIFAPLADTVGIPALDHRGGLPVRPVRHALHRADGPGDGDAADAGHEDVPLVQVRLAHDGVHAWCSAPSS